uniref:Coiled-coil domain-containing protein 15 isoform X3 n=1 Tax=Geotrypetes seraphini TaxID=260995 RepID=A0A6P8PHH1_GEOSA|nr:coiled-coil domain-containing protein 15 isoform X3 [Geotrypetes seraphini]
MVPFDLQPSMEAKSHCARSYTAEPVPNKIKPLRLVVNQNVLAGRNQKVAPVGAWVESGRDQWEQSMDKQAFVSAFQIEAELKKQQKEKQENLKRFQGEVKHRVNQRARLQKKQQLQKSYEAAEKEGLVVKRSSEVAKHLTPKRNICVYRSTSEPTICMFGSSWVSAQPLGDNMEEAPEEDDTKYELFQQQAKTLSKTIKQVRHRLAACRTVQEEAACTELPGGIWRVSPTRDNPVSRSCSPVHLKDEDEFFLKGYHDLPADLQYQMPTLSQTGRPASLVHRKTGKICKKLMKEPYPTGPFPTFSTDYRAALVLQPGVDQEENKKQRQNQYVMYRRLFMDIEREQVKELRRQKEHEKRIAKIKNEKEEQRRTEEQKMQELAIQQNLYLRGRDNETLTQHTLEEESVKESREKEQRSKENVRYSEALRVEMRAKIQLHNIELPPLCSCGTDFWDSHPDTCANNCQFYRNPKGR